MMMMADRGGTEIFVDNELVPEADSLMLDYTVHYRPKKTATAG